MENVPVPLGFITIPSPVKGGWQLLGCRPPVFPGEESEFWWQVVKFRKSGELSSFTEITSLRGALGKASEDHSSCFGSVAPRTEGLAGHSYLAPLEDPPTSLETLLLRSVSISTVTASVGLSHSLHFLSVLFCVFLRILYRTGWGKKLQGKSTRLGVYCPV